MLTGATGHLGCHILFQLLKHTNYKIILLGRKDSIAQKGNLCKLFKHYFNEVFLIFELCIQIICGKLEDDMLGLSNFEYVQLIQTVDCIIHCAALVKHFGSKLELYAANVVITKNLLELSLKTRNKEFHFISTIGVVMDSKTPIDQDGIFTEYDNEHPCLKDKLNNYTESKFLGECLVLEYRKFGVSANIYRVGIQTMNTFQNKFMPNIMSNAFCCRVRGYVKLGVMPIEMVKTDMSPVDYTALAVIKIIEKPLLPHFVFHIFNGVDCNLYGLISKEQLIQLIGIDEFMNNLEMHCNREPHNEVWELCYLHHQLWVGEYRSRLSSISIKKEFSDNILMQLGFKWPIITHKMISELIR